MLEVSELLQSYVHGVRRLTGADAVSLFVPSPSGGLPRALLVHDGDAEPLAELADYEAASAFLAALGAEDSSPAEASSASRLGARPSASGDGTLIPLPSARAALSSIDRQEGDVAVGPGHFGRRRRDGSAKDDAAIPTAWLGLRFLGQEAESRKSWSPDLFFAIGERDDPETWWEWLFSIGGALAGHSSQVSAILRDPVTGLPNRSGFQTVLGEEIEQARTDSTCLALLMVNPDGFAAINERFGREAGDEIVAEISRRLRSSLRVFPVSRSRTL